MRVFETGVWGCQVKVLANDLFLKRRRQSYKKMALVKQRGKEERGRCFLPDQVHFKQKWIKVEGGNFKRVRDLNLDDFLR